MYDKNNVCGARRLPGLLTSLIALSILGVFSVSSAVAGALSKDLTAFSPGSKVDVIIQFHNPPVAADLSRITEKGGSLKLRFKSIPAAVFSVPVAALSGIVANPNIRYISPDRKVTGALEFAEPTVNANIAFSYNMTGSGVGVAIIDSGVAVDHPDLKPRVILSENFVDGETRTDDPYGHGTHVAGIVGGNAASSSGSSFTYTFRGIAPKANLISLRVLNASGQGTDSAVIAAIDQAVALKSTYNIRIVNLSLGRAIHESYTLDPLCQAVQRAWQSGLVVVVAAGNNGRDNSMANSGYATISSPGNSPFVITVGAMKDMGTTSRGDDLIASYSSKGPTLLDHIVKPDLVAPGNIIVSALSPIGGIKTSYPDNVVPVSYYKTSGSQNISPVYFRLSGTSMAAPMVSGAAAVLLQKEPGMTPDQVKARLMKTAFKGLPSASVYTDPSTGTGYQSTYDVFTVGAGYLDVMAALNSNELSNGPALSPTAVYDQTTGTVSVVTDPGSAWADVLVWGTAMVWGTNVIVDGTAMAWGTAMVWGTSTNEGFAMVWGTVLVWGTNQPFPELISIRGDR